MTEWIKCSERLPEPDPDTGIAWVWATDGKRQGECSMYLDFDGDPVWSQPYTVAAITHWMPLPELPEVE